MDENTAESGGTTDGSDGAAFLPPPPPPPPGSLTSVEADVQVVRRGSGRARLVLATLVVAGLLVGGLVLTSRGDEVDPDRALAAAQAVVETSESYRFESREVSRVQQGDPNGSGSDTTTRSLITGTVARSDAWRMVEDLGTTYSDQPEVSTIIRVGDTFYVEDSSMSPGEIVGPRWVTFPASAMDVSIDDLAQELKDFDQTAEDGFDDEYRLDLVLGAYLVQAGDQPRGMTRLVTDATDPAVEERLSDGGVLLRARLAPIPELAKASNEPIPPVDVTLQLDEADRPVLARFAARYGTATADVEVRFSDWGADITIEPPADSDIDHTPWIEEEALAQTDQALLVAPATLPAGMALSGADVRAGDPEFDECKSVELSYTSEAEASWRDLSPEAMDAQYQNLDYLSISVSSLVCAQENDASPFDQDLGGLRARGAEGSWEVEMGAVSVTVNSTFGDDEIAALVASLRPVTASGLAAEIPTWVQDFAASQGWYG